MRKIDTSNSTFEDLLSNGFLYVDKTRYLYDLVQAGKLFFLARPRRFGKSLTLSTLEAIFQGRRELFKDLWIGRSEYDWKAYPVIHVDLANCEGETPEKIEAFLSLQVRTIAAMYGKTLSATSSDLAFGELIDLLAGSQGKTVVVLIDEYDKPLTGNLDNPALGQIRKLLGSFYSNIKAKNRQIRFCMLTGVTKFSRLSLFSDLNNLRDISREARFATMLGFTQEELETSFSDYIEKGCKKAGMTRDAYLGKLKRMYDGYRFEDHAKPVYNPVSVGSFFTKGGVDFNPYWMETGGMQLLFSLSRRLDFDITEELEKPVPSYGVSMFDITELAGRHATKDGLKELLLQTGYLTLSGRQTEFGDSYLCFPNAEVRLSYSTNLLATVSKTPVAGVYGIRNEIDRALERGNLDAAMGQFKILFAKVPYVLRGKKEHEWDYHRDFFNYCLMLDALKADAEVMESRGRPDIVLETSKHLYILECKLEQSPSLAIKQIREKGYADAYLDRKRAKAIHLVGVEFSLKGRNIARWEEELL